MCAIVRVIPDADYEVLREFLDPEGVVLVRESLAKELFGDTCEEVDNMPIDYDFGGEADVWVDFVCDQSHHAVESVRNELSDLSDL